MGPREEVARMEQHNYAVRVSSFSCHAIEGRLRIMDTDLCLCFQFGAGSRTCIGKHISLLEINKVLPQLLRQFDFEGLDDRAWTTKNYWFVKPSYMCRVKVREGNAKV
jgi:hypothetical protein